MRKSIPISLVSLVPVLRHVAIFRMREWGQPGPRAGGDGGWGWRRVGAGGGFGLAFGLRMLLATTLHVISALGAELFSEACRELGFSSSLLCSSRDLLGQSAYRSWILTAEDAAKKQHNLKLKSCMQELVLKSVDESWGSSLKSKE